MMYPEEIWEKESVLNLSKNIYIYMAPPCDFWAGCPMADGLERDIILQLMPETPRDRCVYKSFLPGNGCDLEVFYFCKADNNGTTYIFSNCKDMENEGLEWYLQEVIEHIEVKAKLL